MLLFGCADLSKPRVRLFLAGLEAEGHELLHCNIDIWTHFRDKSQISGLFNYLTITLGWAAATLWLSLKYLVSPKHDVVLVCYPGHLDIWPARLLTWIRRKPLCWDAFLSAYDTVVLDRKMASPNSFIGRLCYFVDWAACRLCDHMFLDTPAHARFFETSFKLASGSVGHVPVGAEDCFNRETVADKKASQAFSVLFYGQFIPLHGIPIILEAAGMLKDTDIHFSLVGQGQMSQWVQEWLEHRPLKNLERIEWIDYADLPTFIRSHDVCLGIFSSGDKAARVIPNKVYQILNSGVPLLTRQSPAMEEFLRDNIEGVTTVLPENPVALKEALLGLQKQWQAGSLTLPSPALVTSASNVGAAASRELMKTCGNN